MRSHNWQNGQLLSTFTLYTGAALLHCLVSTSWELGPVGDYQVFFSLLCVPCLQPCRFHGNLCHVWLRLPTDVALHYHCLPDLSLHTIPELAIVVDPP